MENERDFFSIPHYIDQGRVIMGFPADEIVPALALFFLFAMKNFLVTGIFSAAALFIVIRKIKRIKGENVIALTFFWFAPDKLSPSFFKRTPTSDKKYWLN